MVRAKTLQNTVKRSFERVKADMASLLDYTNDWFSFLSRNQEDLQHRVADLEQEVAELKAELAISRR